MESAVELLASTTPLQTHMPSAVPLRERLLTVSAGAAQGGPVLLHEILRFLLGSAGHAAKARAQQSRAASSCTRNQSRAPPPTGPKDRGPDRT